MGTEDTQAKHDVAKYALLMSRYQYEHSVIWQRFGFLLVAQVAGMGFFFNVLIETIKDPKLATAAIPIATLLSLSFIGIATCWFFRRLTSINYWWLNHWKELLVREEPHAFGNDNVLRNVAAPLKARQQLSLFLLFWVTLWAILAGLVIVRAVI